MLTSNQKDMLQACLVSIFNSGKIPGIETNHLFENFCELLVRKLKEDARLGVLFTTIPNEKEAAEFYLLEMKKYFIEKSNKADFLHQALHKCKD